MRGVDGSSAALAQRLRRLARALCGDTTIADELALATLDDVEPRTTDIVHAFSVLIRLHRNDELPDDLINRRSSRELSVAFSNLPIDLREAMALVVIEELSYRDASQVLGVSLDTLFDRLKRARTLLASRADTGHGAALRLVK